MNNIQPVKLTPAQIVSVIHKIDVNLSFWEKLFINFIPKFGKAYYESKLDAALHQTSIDLGKLQAEQSQDSSKQPIEKPIEPKEQDVEPREGELHVGLGSFNDPDAA